MRWKQLLKRVVITVLLCLLVRTIWFVGQREWYRAAGNREVAAAVAEIAVTDPRWEYEALNADRPKPPADRNGAALVPKITALFPGEWARGSFPADWEPTAPPQAANVRFPASTINQAKEKLVALHSAVELARTFKDYPSGYRDIHLTTDVLSTPLQDTTNTRPISLLLRWDTVMAVEEGNTARACDTVAAMLNASRSLGDEPFLISQLVRISTRMIATGSLEWVLAQSDPSEAQLAILQAAWSNDAEEPLLLYGLRGERAVWDVMFKNLTEGAISGNEIKDRKNTDISFDGFAWWLYRPRLLADRAYCLRWMTQAIDAARKPINEQAAALQTLPPIEEATHLKLAPLFLPAAEKVAGAHHRSVAEMRCAVAGIACERFRLKHGHWPQSLPELCPDFLAVVPLDPFDGQPLRYTKRDDGVIVHSLVPKVNSTASNSRPALPEGFQIGFRLWNPEARRQPATPEPGENQP